MVVVGGEGVGGLAPREGRGGSLRWLSISSDAAIGMGSCLPYRALPFRAEALAKTRRDPEKKRPGTSAFSNQEVKEGEEEDDLEFEGEWGWGGGGARDEEGEKTAIEKRIFVFFFFFLFFIFCFLLLCCFCGFAETLAPWGEREDRYAATTFDWMAMSLRGTPRGLSRGRDRRANHHCGARRRAWFVAVSRTKSVLLVVCKPV